MTYQPPAYRSGAAALRVQAQFEAQRERLERLTRQIAAHLAQRAAPGARGAPLRVPVAKG